MNKIASTSNIKKLKELLGVEQNVTSSQAIVSVEVEGKNSVDEMDETLFSMKNSGKVKQFAKLFNPNNKKEHKKVKAGPLKVAIDGIFKATVSPSLMNKIHALATPRKKCPPPPVPPKKIQSQKAAPSDDTDKQTDDVTNPKLFKGPAYLIGDKVTCMPKEVLVDWNVFNKKMCLRGKKQSKGKGKWM